MIECHLTQPSIWFLLPNRGSQNIFHFPFTIHYVTQNKGPFKNYHCWWLQVSNFTDQMSYTNFQYYNNKHSIIKRERNWNKMGLTKTTPSTKGCFKSIRLRVKPINHFPTAVHFHYRSLFQIILQQSTPLTYNSQSIFFFCNYPTLLIFIIFYYFN